jgi:hypothetical protein
MMTSLTKARTAILQVLGLGCIDLSAFNLSTTLGFFAVGISLFIIEALTGSD